MCVCRVVYLVVVFIFAVAFVVFHLINCVYKKEMNCHVHSFICRRRRRCSSSSSRRWHRHHHHQQQYSHNTMSAYICMKNVVDVVVVDVVVHNTHLSIHTGIHPSSRPSPATFIHSFIFTCTNIQQEQQQQEGSKAS